ncbi:MAG: flagellar hook-length control protein FliK [Alphaproteobacteria bacterium]|nr:flagellar hook-length control protein FliK [Alphaproteobacteria bacterium]
MLHDTNYSTAPPRPPMPLSNQVAIQLHNAAKDDVRRITIHLRPEQLGKVEVSMEVDQSGRLQAVISADKPETLDWLRRDAQHLERALQDAGMKTDQGSLSFNLRGEQQNNTEPGQRRIAGGFGQGGDSETDLAELPMDGIVRRLDALVDVSV